MGHFSEQRKPYMMAEREKEVKLSRLLPELCSERTACFLQMQLYAIPMLSLLLTYKKLLGYIIFWYTSTMWKSTGHPPFAFIYQSYGHVTLKVTCLPPLTLWNCSPRIGHIR